ncbi:MAG: class I SAM-dependent methyltransferase, partial [Armatimonadota bacterium]
AGRAEIVEGHAAHLPWPDGHFTCCACVATFLFLPDPMAALAEMRRVLAPGGRLVIITPASRAPAFVRSMHSGGDDAARLYSRAELAQMLAEAGFGSIAVDLASKRLVAYAEVPRPAP